MIPLTVIKERRQSMEQKIDREWKSIVCPGGKEKSVVMCQWDILSEKSRILKRTLKQIDCHNPKLTEFGGPDCNWACAKALATEETARSGMELLLVCAILGVSILWIAFYGVYMKPYLHLYGLFLFFGIPFFIGLMLYYTWKMMRHMGIFKRKEILT
jgi:hypothetical protein